MLLFSVQCIGHIIVEKTCLRIPAHWPISTADSLFTTMTSQSKGRPDFDSLPLHSGDPPFSAWGLYGDEDELGTLNLLTDLVVREAAKEIWTGQRVGLDLPLDFAARPSHNRQPLTHTVLRKDPRLVHDDVLHFNTQISTQWDGFRHYGYQRERKFYNDVQIEDISGPGHPKETGTAAWYQGPSVTTKLGIQAWCAQGIVGRGVLLDYRLWAELTGRPYEALSRHAIDVDDLQRCADAQGVVFRQGDVLIVRTGWTQGYRGMTTEQQIAYSHAEPTVLVGVATSVKTLRWMWQNGFSACCADTPGWERWPALEGDGEVGGIGKLRLHEVLLNGWGMPIGELFDLERLSQACLALKRWTFYFSSMPLHVPGGVASPCNAMAVF